MKIRQDLVCESYPGEVVLEPGDLLVPRYTHQHRTEQGGWFCAGTLGSLEVPNGR